MATNLLERRVLSAVRSIVADRLMDVNYWALRFEMTSSSQINDPEFYFGGEVELQFRDSGPVFISWDENAGWPHHFSVQAQRSSLFLPGILVSWPARGVEAWTDMIGLMAVEAEILGREGVPHVVALGLGETKVYIGDGSEQTFCDGDDVLVRIGDADSQLSQLERLWTSENH